MCSDKQVHLNLLVEAGAVGRRVTTRRTLERVVVIMIIVFVTVFFMNAVVFKHLESRFVILINFSKRIGIFPIVIKL